MSAYSLQAPWPALAPALTGGVAWAGRWLPRWAAWWWVLPSGRPSLKSAVSPFDASCCEWRTWRPRSRHRCCRFPSVVALDAGTAFSLLFFQGQRKRCFFFLIRPLPLFSFFFWLLSYCFSRVPGLSASTSPSPCKQIRFPPPFQTLSFVPFPHLVILLFNCRTSQIVLLITLVLGHRLVSLTLRGLLLALAAVVLSRLGSVLAVHRPFLGTRYLVSVMRALLAKPSPRSSVTRKRQ